MEDKGIFHYFYYKQIRLTASFMHVHKHNISFCKLLFDYLILVYLYLTSSLLSIESSVLLIIL